jgi:hypothetical protein
LDPETQEVHATFFDFAMEGAMEEDENHSTDSTALLAMEQLREALIRILNVFVPQTAIEEALRDCGGFDKSIDHLTLPEFKGVYKRWSLSCHLLVLLLLLLLLLYFFSSPLPSSSSLTLLLLIININSVRRQLLGIHDDSEHIDDERMNTPPADAFADLDELNQRSHRSSRSQREREREREKDGRRGLLSRGSSHSRASVGRRRRSETGRDGEREREGGHLSVSLSPTPFTALDEYWTSPVGKKSIGLIPKMALPLDLRPLRKDIEEAEKEGEGEGEGAEEGAGKDFPVGAALNVVRKAAAHSHSHSADEMN